MTIHSSRENIHKVSGFVSKIRRFVPIREDLYSDILISLTEAVNNAIVHGNREDARKIVDIRCDYYQDRFEFFIRDEGEGFNAKSLPNPIAPEHLMKEGGRGVFIIRSLMDDVTFQRTDEGMTTRFTAYRSR